jgi:hypothetical protein
MNLRYRQQATHYYYRQHYYTRKFRFSINYLFDKIEALLYATPGEITPILFHIHSCTQLHR